MRLLTKEEREVLVNAAGQCGQTARSGQPWSGGEKEAALSLELTGRVSAVQCYCGAGHWSATPAGREALLLWPLLVERGLVQP